MVLKHREGRGLPTEGRLAVGAILARDREEWGAVVEGVPPACLWMLVNTLQCCGVRPCNRESLGPGCAEVQRP